MNESSNREVKVWRGDQRSVDEWIQKPEKIAANLSPTLKKEKRAASRDTAPTNIGGKGGEEVKSFKVHSVKEQSELWT